MLLLTTQAVRPARGVNPDDDPVAHDPDKGWDSHFFEDSEMMKIEKIRIMIYLPCIGMSC
jgi:hypothetical protein